MLKLRNTDDIGVVVEAIDLGFALQAGQVRTNEQ